MEATLLKLSASSILSARTMQASIELFIRPLMATDDL